MQPDRLASVSQFEICSIRPPTENNSLTFRLTRNCYWNKCAFCPIYKAGSRFGKRTLMDVKADITNARVLDDLLRENGVDGTLFSDVTQNRVISLVDRIRQARLDAGLEVRGRSEPLAGSPDPRMRWFSSWFIEYPDISDCVEHLISWRMSGGRNCFLGDADSLILRPEYVEEVISHVRESFPEIARFTIYGRTRTASTHRSEEDLVAFRKAGIDRVHFGIESGSETVLKMVNKGETPDDHVRGSLKASEAGLSCSFYVMPGLGGSALSEEHAVETARVINRARPDYVRLRTLEIFEGTPLDDMRKKGEFVEADDDTTAAEIEKLIQEISVPVELLSDSATNLLPVFGRLPRDRSKMLGVISEYLSRGRRERLEFSLRSRLESFTGQYGGLSNEILDVISPVVKDRRLDFDAASDEELKMMTRFVKSRLMP